MKFQFVLIKKETVNNYRAKIYNVKLSGTTKKT